MNYHSLGSLGFVIYSVHTALLTWGSQNILYRWQTGAHCTSTNMKFVSACSTAGASIPTQLHGVHDGSYPGFSPESVEQFPCQEIQPSARCGSAHTYRMNTTLVILSATCTKLGLRGVAQVAKLGRGSLLPTYFPLTCILSVIYTRQCQSYSFTEPLY